MPRRSRRGSSKWTCRRTWSPGSTSFSTTRSGVSGRPPSTWWCVSAVGIGGIASAESRMSDRQPQRYDGPLLMQRKRKSEESARQNMMAAFFQDVRYAVRTLRRSAGVTAVIVASLGIGIGANTAIFSVVNALLLKPLPYPEPERLAVLWLRSPGINIPQDWPSPGQYIDLRTENRSFEEMSISRGRSGTLMGVTEAQRVEALETSSSLFQLLGAKP